MIKVCFEKHAKSPNVFEETCEDFLVEVEILN